jgi:hypothetical protein
MLQMRLVTNAQLCSGTVMLSRTGWNPREGILSVKENGPELVKALLKGRRSGPFLCCVNGFSRSLRNISRETFAYCRATAIGANC